jgi:hypothetical protein
VAEWQATFQLVPTRGFPGEYRAWLDQIVPRIRSWSRDVECWGSEDGNRIDVLLERGWPIEGLILVDLRDPNAEFIVGVLGVVTDGGFRLLDEHAREVRPTVREFALALRGSRAFRLIEDPVRYLSRSRAAGLEDA